MRTSRHTTVHTSQAIEPIHAPLRVVVGDIFQGFSTGLRLVWGRVVPDIPDFCRELVAVIAEE